MVYNQIGTTTINCSTGGESSIFSIESDGVLCIQPIDFGTGTGTIYVSNELDNWMVFDPKTSNYDIQEPVMISGASWLYWKIVVNSGGTGSINFRFGLK